MPESKEEILAAVAVIFADVTEVSAENVQLENTLREDLDVDSLTMAELGVALQDRFDVEISDEQVIKLKTVADVVSAIHGALVPA
jgi:acyl carrier protein